MSQSQIQEELKNLVHLLYQEKQADLQQYRKKMLGTSLKERRLQGVCWFPVKLEKTKFDAGERLIIKVSRPPEHKDAHLFQSGKLVSFFSSAGGIGDTEDAVNGVVNNTTKQEMLITINADEVPEWVHHGQLGVQLLFDENAYREMDKTLSTLIKSNDNRISELKNVLLGSKPATFDTVNIKPNLGLNDSQNAALQKIHNANDLAIIHGPPGTGKTTTLVQAILETLNNENQLLVCAPSNAAVDLLSEKLAKRNIEVLRLGHPARVNEEILSKTLDARIANHNNYKNLKDLRKQSEEYYGMAKKYKRNFGPNERSQRNAIKAEARKLKEDARQLEFYIMNDILAKTQVITCTLVGASNQAIKGMTFNTVFIDEAAQSLEPACWIPILKANRVIFAGDHYQLPPTVRSFDAAKKGLEVTLFEKSIRRNDADVMLNEQYRMNEKIMTFSSRFFYKNSLIANKEVKDWSVFSGDQVVEFIDTAGCAFYEAVDKETRSSYNQEEAHLLLKHLIQYLEKVELTGHADEIQNIGIISPYKAQVTLLNELILEKNMPIDAMDKININTVDSFQGQERDVIYISLVRSNDNGEIGFLSDTRRMNVAMTRAKKKLVVIGDSGTIGQHPFYETFLDYINEMDAYHSAFEFGI